MFWANFFEAPEGTNPG